MNSSENSGFGEKVWLYNFRGEDFIGVDKLVDDDLRITVEEGAIPIKNVSIFMGIVWVGVVCVIAVTEPSLPIAFAETLLAAIGAVSFLAMLFFAESERRGRKLFYVCKATKSLHLKSGTTIEGHQILYFRNYVTSRQNFKLVLLSVGFYSNSSVFEAPVVAMTGRLSENADVGQALAFHFGVSISTSDVKRCKRLVRELFE